MTLSYQHLDIDVPVTTDRKSFFKLYNLRPCISGTSIYESGSLQKIPQLQTFENHVDKSHDTKAFK